MIVKNVIFKGSRGQVLVTMGTLVHLHVSLSMCLKLLLAVENSVTNITRVFRVPVLPFDVLPHGALEYHFSAMHAHFSWKVSRSLEIWMDLLDVLSHQDVTLKILWAVAAASGKFTSVHFLYVVFVLQPRFELVKVRTLYIGTSIVVKLAPFSEVIQVLPASLRDVPAADADDCLNFSSWRLVNFPNV